MTALLEVRDLTVRYGKVTAVESVDLTLGEGGSIALLGANGAGKTTILRSIGRLLRFHGGSTVTGDILFEGKSTRGISPARLVDSGIGQCLEGRRIFGDMTVRDNLLLGAYVSRARRDSRRRYDEMLQMFPALQKHEGTYGAMLSGGEQQMLAIARALMSQPRLLLLDEPSLGLAPLMIEEIGRILRRISEMGTAIVLVDQTVALPAAATDYAYLLDMGNIAGEGPTATLLADDAVRRSYLGIANANGDK